VTARGSLLADLRVAIDDAHAVAVDMLRAPRRRDLGPREHRRLYQEAHGKLTRILAELDADERGDPAGLGGSGAE
jgi:hypothetical protein